MFGLVPYSWRKRNIARRDDIFGIDRFFEDFFRDPFFERWSLMANPIRADVKETDTQYIIEAELPGVKKEDIFIDLQGNVLTLGVDMKQETNEEDDGYIYKERRSGSFRRSFNVENIREEDIKANYKNGLLTVILPKVEPDKRSKRIEIE